MQPTVFAGFLACALLSAAMAGRSNAQDAPGFKATTSVVEPASSDATTKVEPSSAPKRGSSKLSAAYPTAMEEICATLAAEASAHQLPLSFFVRLIWQESGFRSNVVSWAGARGIAQFMPGTAEWRGLADPHDPIQALRKSADYLRELWAQFGNLGLAAAAYNGGSGRVQAWLEGRGSLPEETRHYVHIVTGIPVEQWREHGKDIPRATNRLPANIPCPSLLAAAPSENDLVANVPSMPVRQAAVATPTLRRGAWGVIIAGDKSRERAHSQFAKVQRQFNAILGGLKPIPVTRRVPGLGALPVTTILIEEPNRASADRLCARLRANGGSCMVKRAS